MAWEFVRRDGKFVYGDWTHPQYGDQRLLPLWLADMDFMSPPAVSHALVEHAKRGVFGYTVLIEGYLGIIVQKSKET